MSELPKVYVNKIEKDINNCQNNTYADQNNRISYDNIISNDRYSFNHVFDIYLQDGTKITSSIIRVSEDKILTIDNIWIDKKDIKSINEKM